MTKIVGVRFRTAGKIYYFDPLDFEIKKGDHVIVDTARGMEYGTAVSGIKELEDDKISQPLKPVKRIATDKDDKVQIQNAEKEKEAYKICLEKIKARNLDMKLIDAEYTFDNNKILFYFTADGRVDFRELVKDLAGVFRTRIELRQVGVRDEAKILGGIGICGRPLCCHTFLSEFAPVSIKMAKEQNLSLNPTKISGVCGRLMCCLKNEEDAYEELNRHMPNMGETVTLPDGRKGNVYNMNVLRQTVKVVVELDDDTKEIEEYSVDDIRFRRRHFKNRNNDEEESSELKELEDKPGDSVLDGEDDGEAKPKNREHRGKNRENREGRGNGENRGGRRREGRGNGENRGNGEGRGNGENRGGKKDTQGGGKNRENRGGGQDERNPKKKRTNR
ncbi:MAG: stage 0 sporulation family protein [Lachnospiraceae bacterium]|nr:stage 0 sporulation family protein [Lachnospiraceae bacterium]